MTLVHIVAGAALLQYLLFSLAVASARGKYGVRAPATTGNEIFERYYRVQMNTLEMLIVFLPSLWLFATYINPRWAAVLGGIVVVGRTLYFRSYVKDPSSRSLGFSLGFIPMVILLLGGLGAAVLALIRGTS